jgi:hypothetical protein
MKCLKVQSIAVKSRVVAHRIPDNTYKNLLPAIPIAPSNQYTPDKVFKGIIYTVRKRG